MGHPPPVEPMTKVQIAKTACFGIFVMILWIGINTLLYLTLDFARQNIKIVDDLP